MNKPSLKEFGDALEADGEMRKKTVIHRLLKLYQDDPGIGRAMELDRGDIEDELAAAPIAADAVTQAHYSPDAAGDDLESVGESGEVDSSEGREP